MTTDDRWGWAVLVSALILAALVATILTCGCGPTYRTMPDGTRATIDYQERHGVRVSTGGFAVDRTELEGVIEDTIQAYARHIPERELRAVLDPSWPDQEQRPFLAFRPLPFPCTASPTGRCAGLYQPPKILEVGYRAPLSSTALPSELGHLFLCRLRSLCGEDAHEWAQERGLP